MFDAAGCPGAVGTGEAEKNEEKKKTHTNKESNYQSIAKATMNIDPNVCNCATPTRCNCLESGEADLQVLSVGSGGDGKDVQQSALELPFQ